MTNKTSVSHDVERSLRPFSRRSFLVSGLTVGAALMTLGLTACSSEVHVAPAGIEYLGSSEITVLEKLIEALLPTEGTPMVAASSIPIINNVDTMFGEMNPKTQADLKVALKLFNYGSAVFSRHFTQFSKLDAQVARSYIDDWQNGLPMQRAIATVLKKFIYLAYWRDERTWPPLEYEGPVSDRWNLPSLGNAPIPV
jgi:hypothetical protein